MDRNQCEAAAVAAAKAIKKRLQIKDPPNFALVLGTGWGDALALTEARGLSFSDLPGFAGLGFLAGHKRDVVYGYMGKTPVVILSGRVHTNESLFDARLICQVRLQIEMLIKLGVGNFILTCAAGGLPASGRPVHVDDLVAIDGFCTLFANTPMPLFAGDFVSADDVISHEWLRVAMHYNRHRKIRVRQGGYAFLRGSGFEGRKYDKGVLTNTGVSSVGMSVVPEAFVCALYRSQGVRVLPVAFITNSALEEHSHVQNLARAKKKSEHLGTFLTYLVNNVPD